MPGIVACVNCNAFRRGVKFCGKCGNHSFSIVSETQRAFRVRCSGGDSAGGIKVLRSLRFEFIAIRQRAETFANRFPSNSQRVPARQFEKICGLALFPLDIKFGSIISPEFFAELLYVSVNLFRLNLRALRCRIITRFFFIPPEQDKEKKE